LRIAAASSVISQEVLYVVVGEIDTVLRSLNQYISVDPSLESAFLTQNTPAKQRSATAPIATGHAPSRVPKRTANTTAQPSVSPDRRTRIQTILEAKGEATIKDISEIITDCSEKTVQRELNAMIEDNIVKRQGERRWSKYSIA